MIYFVVAGFFCLTIAFCFGFWMGFEIHDQEAQSNREKVRVLEEIVISFERSQETSIPAKVEDVWPMAVSVVKGEVSHLR